VNGVFIIFDKSICQLFSKQNINMINNMVMMNDLFLINIITTAQAVLKNGADIKLIA